MIRTLEWTFGNIHRFFWLSYLGRTTGIWWAYVYVLEIDSTSVVDATVCCPDSEVAGVLDGDDLQLRSSLGITQCWGQPPHPSSHPLTAACIQRLSNAKGYKGLSPLSQGKTTLKIHLSSKLLDPWPFQFLPLSSLLLPLPQRCRGHSPINYLRVSLHLRICFLENPTKTTGEENNGGGNDREQDPAAFKTVLLGQSVVKPLQVCREAIFNIFHPMAHTN